MEAREGNRRDGGGGKSFECKKPLSSKSQAVRRRYFFRGFVWQFNYYFSCVYAQKAITSTAKKVKSDEQNKIKKSSMPVPGVSLSLANGWLSITKRIQDTHAAAERFIHLGPGTNNEKKHWRSQLLTLGPLLLISICAPAFSLICAAGEIRSECLFVIHPRNDIKQVKVAGTKTSPAPVVAFYEDAGPNFSRNKINSV